MISGLARLLGIRRARFTRPSRPVRPKLLLSAACVDGLADCLAPATRKGHEGVAYLFGRTDGSTTLAISAMRPEADTTRGSFHVDSRAMSHVVRAATNFGLQVVAQVHTHPGEAYHSDGDIEGARIRYAGYASIVLPEYGRHLPRFDGAAVYLLDNRDNWVELDAAEIIVVRERMS